MVKSFKITDTIAKLIDKAAFFRVLSYIDEHEKIETPCLIIVSSKVKDKIALIGSGIRNCKLFYAVKANPSIEVLSLINEIGAGFEISSDGELAVLEKLAVSPDRIITSNPVKTVKFIEKASRYGITYYAYDSLAEIEKLSQIAPKSSVYVRLTTPNEGSEWPLSKKFGVELDDALNLLIKAKKADLNPCGITFHVGSQCNNIYNWNIAIDKAKLLFDKAKDAGLNLNLLNLGGGYPIKYTKDVLRIDNIESLINKLITEKFPDNINVHIEPGRAVIGDAGILVTSVTGKAKRADEDWLYIDAGVFNGLMESIGGIKYSYVLEGDDYSAIKQWTLAGPSCDSFDVIAANVPLHEPKIGDLLLILSGGAYTISYASEFNGCAIPRTIII
ncbi:ornithine decarboxylase [Candidatus Magnetoovum chiemensis]|nr:ornithine decarboxylase [Candidatus Magnetoovum chiemensis]